MIIFRARNEFLVYLFCEVTFILIVCKKQVNKINICQNSIKFAFISIFIVSEISHKQVIEFF